MSFGFGGKTYYSNASLEVLHDLLEDFPADRLFGLCIDELAKIGFGLHELRAIIVHSVRFGHLLGCIVERLDTLLQDEILRLEIGDKIPDVREVLSTQRLWTEVITSVGFATPIG